MSDAAKLKSLDPSSWVDEFGDFLFRRALMLLGKPELAEDLVQDTFLAACQSIDSFRGDASLKTWLAQILKNRAIDFMRKASRREVPTSFDESYDEDHQDFSTWGIWKNAAERWGVWQELPSDSLENQGLANTLLDCLEKLPATQKNVLRLKVFEDLPIEEICKELELKSSNVGVLLFRARLALRNCLDSNWYKKL